MSYQLNNSSNLAEERDFVGKKKFTLDSDIYDFTIKVAYVTKSVSGALALNVVLDDGQGNEMKNTIYFTTNAANGTRTYYIDKNDKSEQPLPGYSVANAICVFGAKMKLDNALTKIQQKAVKIWNSEAKKEVPTEVDVITPLTGAKVKMAVQEVIEDATSKNATTGKWEPNGKVRTINDITKVMRSSDSFTMVEAKAKAEEAVFAPSWLEANKGKPYDKSTGQKAAGSSGGAGAGASIDDDDDDDLFD